MPLPAFRSLYAKIVASNFLLLCLLGVIQLGLFSYFWTKAQHESAQTSQGNIAETIALRMKPYLEGTIDLAKLFVLAKNFEEMSPGLNIYLIDSSGRVLQDFSIDPVIHAPYIVDMEQVRRRLAETDRSKLIYGTDPREKDQAIFSVAPTQIGTDPGYVYAIISGQHGRRLHKIFQEHAAFRFTLLSFITAVLAVNFIGLLLFKTITHRFSKVLKTVRAIQSGNLTARLPATAADDELNQLSTAINEMGDAIVGNISKLEKKDELRRELISNLWHDLRGPVSSINLLVQLLRERKEASTENRETLEDGITKNTELLARLMDELLELSKLETKEVAPKLTPISIGLLFDDLSLMLGPQAASAGVEFRISLPEAPLPKVLGDRLMLARVLTNLAQNALRYTPKGGVVLLTAAPSAGGIEISVSDTGIGISAENLTRLFDRNFQIVEDGITAGAMGLGLAIVKKIIEGHGSEIYAESVREKGSRFHFTLKPAP